MSENLDIYTLADVGLFVVISLLVVGCDDPAERKSLESRMNFCERFAEKDVIGQPTVGKCAVDRDVFTEAAVAHSEIEARETAARLSKAVELAESLARHLNIDRFEPVPEGIAISGFAFEMDAATVEAADGHYLDIDHASFDFEGGTDGGAFLSAKMEPMSYQIFPDPNFPGMAELARLMHDCQSLASDSESQGCQVRAYLSSVPMAGPWGSELATIAMQLTPPKDDEILGYYRRKARELWDNLDPRTRDIPG